MDTTLRRTDSDPHLVARRFFKPANPVPAQGSATEIEAYPLAELAEPIAVAGLEPSLAAPPLRPVPRNVELPLSVVQERLWFLDQLQPGNPVHDFSIALRLQGSLKAEALERSLQEIVRRHEVLRTTFQAASGLPFQVISGQVPFRLLLTDLRALPELERQNKARQVAEEQANQPFDLAQDLPLRASLIRLADEDWRQHLGGAPGILELPTDRPRPPVQSYRGARETLVLDREVSVALKELSRQQGVPLFITLLAAFKVLLGRYSGQEDIVVGVPVTGRSHRGLEDVIGLFANTLAVRTDLSGNPTFRELLGRVREVTLGALAHRSVPFELLVEELQPERNLSRSPLFQVMFVLRNGQHQLRWLDWSRVLRPRRYGRCRGMFTRSVGDWQRLIESYFGEDPA
jgi:hypothetical protein